MKIKFFSNKNFTTAYKLNTKYSTKSISGDKSLFKAVIVSPLIALTVLALLVLCFNLINNNLYSQSLKNDITKDTFTNIEQMTLSANNELAFDNTAKSSPIKNYSDNTSRIEPKTPKTDNSAKTNTVNQNIQSSAITQSNISSSTFNTKYKNVLQTQKQDKSNTVSISSNNTYKVEKVQLNPHLPDYFNYHEINKSNLQAYLKSRNSLLAEEPYFSSIINISKEYGLNPLILFAITGQEQSFVPKNNKYAYKIANNPYNVFNSWIKYNTDIKDTTAIAARTVINLSKNRPENVDPFTWINRKYADDMSWAEGVRSIYKKLSKIAS